MTITIEGKVKKGDGKAKASMRDLIPLLVPHFPEIEGCRDFGTINMKLQKPLNNADCWTPRVIWDAFEVGRREIFGFLRIKFRCSPDNPLHQAWIFLPEGAYLTYYAFHAEIIANAHIPGVKVDAGCCIESDHAPGIPRPSCFGDFFGGLIVL